MPEADTPRRHAYALPLALLLLGSLFLTALWTLLAIYLQRMCGWMAVVAAFDAAMLLRLGGLPRGLARPVLAVAATVCVIVLANWFIAATQIGLAMGLNPWESAMKLGAGYAWTLAGLANQGAEKAWMALALVVAAVVATRGR